MTDSQTTNVDPGKLRTFEGRPAVTNWRDPSTMTFLKRKPGWLRRAWYGCTGRQWGYVLVHEDHEDHDDQDA